MVETTPKPELEIVDYLALFLLKDFIASRFPASDPMKQIDAAYTYAELMTKRRHKDHEEVSNATPHSNSLNSGDAGGVG